MLRIVILLLLAAAVWKGYVEYQARSNPDTASLGIAEVSDESTSTTTEASPSEPARPHKCDGRTHCSEMSSCDEATFFLKNCPGVKMDGNDDGIPCEKQWCKPRVNLRIRS